MVFARVNLRAGVASLKGEVIVSGVVIISLIVFQQQRASIRAACVHCACV
jgi:hypothetical protein